MSRRANQDSEPSVRVSMRLTPEEAGLVERLKEELYQTGKGITGLFRVLLLEEARRRGWPSPYAAAKATTEAAEARRDA